ncbi:hypothetical protein INT44_005568 [Umbelopsis vinacea]|uniref:Uncharacterized protein n=1 Tax=Umbelopsis vinacea TaxID=44442 RepID=A0A8H7PE00_9FUNG|nr:hypothetical protein INT44_005568 [Umbelopsis vinacea]
MDLFEGNRMNGGLVKARSGRFHGSQRLLEPTVVSTWVFTNEKEMSADRSDEKSRHVNKPLRRQSREWRLSEGSKWSIPWIPKAPGVDGGIHMGLYERERNVT